MELLSREDGHLKPTHALLLLRLSGHFPSLDLVHWARRCDDEKLSVSELKDLILAEEVGPPQPPVFTSLFDPDGTDLRARVVHFAVLRLDLKGLSGPETETLRTELRQILDLLGQ